MNKTSWVPNQKVVMGTGLGGSLAFIVVWILNANGIDVPSGGEAAIGSLLVGLLAYLSPNGSGK